MWEIKPGALAASAVLQLWAYLDNYEVARVFNGLVEDGGSTQPIEPGLPKTLPPAVTEKFTLRIRGINLPLTVFPYTVDRLPGLILYTIGVDTGRRGRPAAAQTLAIARDQMNQLLLAAGRSERERREATIAMWELAEKVAIGTAVVCGVVFVVAGGVLIATAAGGGAAVGGGVAVTESVGATVTNIAVRRALLNAVTKEAIREGTKKAAGVIIVTAAGSQVALPPEVSGHAIDNGLKMGTQLAPPLR